VAFMILFSGFLKIHYFGVISFNPDRGYKNTFNFRKLSEKNIDPIGSAVY